VGGIPYLCLAALTDPLGSFGAWFSVVLRMRHGSRSIVDQETKNATLASLHLAARALA
jgi:hypothetical protein